MTVEVQINNSSNPRARFVSWAPSPCRIRMTNSSGAPAPVVSVRLTSTAAPNAGAVVFRAGPAGLFSSSVTLPVPVTGASVPFFVAGRFARSSTNNGDIRIDASVGGTPVGSVRLMVRVRKNANVLTAAERNRFIAALARLNNQGAGRFVDFRTMHTFASDAEAHRRPGFLPWHRAYLLDLERELQLIDPSVALPYWRFDQPAPNLFRPDFLGTSDALGTVQFAATNPLQFWVTDGVQGVNRRPFFDTALQSANVITEAQTLALGAQYPSFRVMEGNPHGSAHTSFGGSISSIDTAARDPLFFLLHCNVDRLWAKWQRQNSRFNPADAAAYDSATANRVGHRLPDTMWPWNGVTTAPRPSTAPGGALATSSTTAAPGPQPRVQDTLDYQGRISPTARMGFDYDDVPFL